MIDRTTLPLIVACLCLPSLCLAADDGATPEWIWAQPTRAAGQQVCLFSHFDVASRPVQARLRGVADYSHAVIYLNSREVGRREPYEGLLSADVTEKLHSGRNVLGVCCRSADGPAAAFLQLELEFEDGRRQTLATGKHWQTLPLRGTDLDWPAVDDAEGQAAATFGRVGRFPWGDATDTVTVRPLDDYDQWTRAKGDAAATDPATFQVLPGFEIELLRSAREDEGSWVAMTFDPRGRMVVAREKHGLLRLTLPTEAGGEVRVDVVNDTLHECRGLLFAHGSLYAMANNDKGLYRLRDTDGDDRFDDVRLLKQFDGGVGHGRNQLVLGPDDMLYAIFGDSVHEPADAKARPPALSRPDSAERTRSGFLARCDAEGGQWEVLARGLRNPFGIAFNADGEPFTYDADAEYDMGAPWYRPTRVDHLVSGADFGWREVTTQWPPYVPDRPDMPQPTLDIGKGSPTAVLFGAGSRFPPEYQQALYVLDWAYGRILAVHLAACGSSYAAKAETFVRGRPANVTDAAIGPDGAMYFVTGGRGTHAALYRVRYSGPGVPPAELTVQDQERNRHALESRRLRRRLEAFHGRQDETAIAAAWPHLSSSDPWIRHAARAAIEWQPVETWQQRALGETDREAALQGLLALSRVGPAAARGAILQRLTELPFEGLSERQRLTVLFISERCLVEDDVDDGLPSAIRDALDRHYPDASPAVNRRLCLLLKRLGAARLVERTMPLLETARDQEQRIHIVYALRDVKEGWTPTLRQAYFEQLQRFEQFVGGDGMPKFQRLIANEALATVPAEEREWYLLVMQARINRWLAKVPLEPRPLVRKWHLDDLAGTLDAVDKGRDFAQGERMFAAAKCIACHRVGTTGGLIGPDLSSVSSRFRPRDVLVSILDPSRVIAEKYQSDIFVLDDGRTITGTIAPGGDFRAPTLRVVTDPLQPDQIVEFSKSAVELHKRSAVSPMPAGLLDTLNAAEILDLLAYVNAAGNAEHPCFRPGPSAD